jgi:uncharacterized protein (TIGR03435 family)
LYGYCKLIVGFYQAAHTYQRMQPTADSALLQQFVGNQSDEAFATLVTRHVNVVYSVALRQTGNPHHAEEITQAVFITLAKKAAQLRHHKALSSWLFQTTRLTANNFIRGEMRRRHREEEACMQNVSNESDTDGNLWPKIEPLLDSAVEALSEKDRHAILLRFYEGRNLREVGAALGTSEDAAEKRVTRALEKLHRYFNQQGISSTTAIIAGTISAHSVQAAPTMLAKSVTTTAMAKGAAASTSILTLTKGALKLMAWTKAKTAIVLGFGVLLAIGTTTAIQKRISNRDYEDLFIHMDSAHLKAAPPALMLRPTRYPGHGNLAIGGTPEVPGKFIARNRPIEYLLLDAYGVTPQRMVFPNGMPTGKFDFLATQPDDPKAGLRKLIEKQLGLTGHIETREEDVLIVRVARTGASGLKITSSPETSVFSDPGTMTITNFKMPEVVECLGLLFNQPMVDETKLTNSYDLELHWNGRFDIPKSEDQKQQVERALLDQAGFELVPGRQPVEMLIVEKEW